MSFLSTPLQIVSSYPTAEDKPPHLVLHPGDAFEFVKTLPDNSVSLVITSPPYNLGKAYETQTSIEAYLDKHAPLIDDLYRLLRPDGNLCWQVGNCVENGEIYPLDIYYYPLFKHAGFQLRNRIIWTFGHGFHARKRFSGRYETILWFSKTKDYKFNLDPVRVPAKYPGKRHYKGKHRGKPSSNPKGKNPSDYWEIVLQDWEREIWDVPNVKANHAEKTNHPCQYPIELVERCVLALTDAGDTVFDPFAGVGSSAIAALKHDRRAIACEQNADYIETTRSRLQALTEGRLKMRPLGKPVHQPTGREKIARPPQEWQDATSDSTSDPNVQQLDLL